RDCERAFVGLAWIVEDHTELSRANENAVAHCRWIGVDIETAERRDQRVFNSGNRLKLRVHRTQVNALAKAQPLECKESNRAIRINCWVERRLHSCNRRLLRKRVVNLD